MSWRDQSLAVKFLTPIILVFVAVIIAAFFYVPGTVEQFAIAEARSTAVGMVNQYRDLRTYYTPSADIEISPMPTTMPI